MTRDEAVDIIMFRSGNRTDAGFRNAIIAEMVFVQENTLEGANFHPMFLMTEDAETEATIGEERIPLPNDFIIEWEEGALYLQEDDGCLTLLCKADMDDIRTNISGAGKPTYYDLVGDYFIVGPTPDKEYTFQMKYYATDVSLAGTYGDATNIENKWLKHASDWFIAEVGVIIAAQHLYNDKMAGIYLQQAQMAKRELMNFDVAKREANKDRNLGAN